MNSNRAIESLVLKFNPNTVLNHITFILDSKVDHKAKIIQDDICH